jgi:hypothetical protein
MNLFDSFAVLVWRAGLDAKCDYRNPPGLEFTGRTNRSPIEPEELLAEIARTLAAKKTR